MAAMPTCAWDCKPCEDCCVQRLHKHHLAFSFRLHDVDKALQVRLLADV